MAVPRSKFLAATARSRRRQKAGAGRTRFAPPPCAGGDLQKLQFRWAETISPKEWVVYRRAIEAVRGAGIRFLLGGGFALASYTGRWRDTKDIDFYIHPRDRKKAIAAL